MTLAVAIGPIQWYRPVVRISPLIASALPLMVASSATAATFTLDPVLVADMRALDGLSEQRADELHEILEARIAEQFLTVSIDELADYESYTARKYVESCPVTQLDGCAFVLGERGETLWTLIGTVEDNGDGHDVTVTFVDVEASRSLITVENVLSRGDEATWASTMTSVLNLIVEGAAGESDIRPDDSDAFEESWERRRAEAERAASELGEAGGLDTLVRIPLRTDVKPPKVTREEVEEYEETDATTPWDRLGMTQTEYLRFRNSDMDLEAYRQRLLGRLGRIQFRAAVGGGSGPFSTYYDGRWARDPETLAVVHVESFQQVVSGNSTVAELELGFGVLPVLDISGVLGFRTGNFEYYQHQETVGEPEPEGTPDPRTISTRHIGFRATFAPMPFARVRPIATGAFLIWSGKRVDQLVGLPEPLQTNVFVAPTLSLLELAPGIEADAHEMVSVFGRLGVVVPVAGTREWETSVGEGLETVGTRRALGGFGMSGMVGVQIHYGVIKAKSDVPSQFDDEPPDDFDDEPPFDLGGDILDID